MKFCQAYQFKLKTDKKIESLFYQYSGSCRFVWNKALLLVKDRLLAQQIDKTVNQNVLTHYKKPDYLPNYYDLALFRTAAFDYLSKLQTTVKDGGFVKKNASKRG